MALEYLRHGLYAKQCAHRTPPLGIVLRVTPGPESQHTTLSIRVYFPECECELEDPDNILLFVTLLRGNSPEDIESGNTIFTEVHFTTLRIRVTKALYARVIRFEPPGWRMSIVLYPSE